MTERCVKPCYLQIKPPGREEAKFLLVQVAGLRLKWIPPDSETHIERWLPQTPPFHLVVIKVGRFLVYCAQKRAREEIPSVVVQTERFGWMKNRWSTLIQRCTIVAIRLSKLGELSQLSLESGIFACIRPYTFVLVMAKGTTSWTPPTTLNLKLYEVTHTY